jgi:hypothetical protein
MLSNAFYRHNLTKLFSAFIIYDPPKIESRTYTPLTHSLNALNSSASHTLHPHIAYR